MRLIDADALRERTYHDAFETDSDMQKWDSGCWIRYKMFENALEETPTVDAIEVVRCKDCKKYIPCQKLPIGTSKWCDLFDRATCEMNYCGWGERREDGKTD